MKNILVIDDQPDTCDFVKRNLEAIGDFRVWVCCDGREALQDAKRLQPDLILLDLLMSGISGPEIAEQLTADLCTQAIPLVFLSAVVSGRELRERNNFIGGHYMVSEPVYLSELIPVIHYAISM